VTWTDNTGWYYTDIILMVFGHLDVKGGNYTQDRKINIDMM